MPPDIDAIRAGLARIPNPVAVLENLFALAPVGFQIYEASGRSVLVNQAFLDLFGSEPPPGYNVLEDEIAERTGVLSIIHRAFKGETVTVPVTWYDPRELRRVTVEKGNRVAIVTTFFPLFDRQNKVSHVGVVFRDVTAETIAREALESERELLSTVVEQIAEGIIVCDAQGVVRLANRAAREIAVKQVDVPAEKWPETYDVRRADGSVMPLEETPLYRALRGEANETVVYLRHAEGLRAIVSSAVPLRRPDGTIRGAVVAVRDETERLRREEEAARTAHFRERFIGILGHDLRSPITAIAANAGLILRHGELPEAVTSAAARSASTAMRMGRMISDLLDFTQARLGGALAVHRKPCDVRDVAQAAIDEVVAANPSRSATLRATGDTKGAFDPDRVAQLLANLLNNAFAYSPESAAVEVAVEGLDGAVEISVSNQGPAIAPDEVQRIFDPFRRGSAAHGRQGLGLGLYIVQQIAVAHGGTVSVRSTEGRTTFCARLQR